MAINQFFLGHVHRVVDAGMVFISFNLGFGVKYSRGVIPRLSNGNSARQTACIKALLQPGTALGVVCERDTQLTRVPADVYLRLTDAFASDVLVKLFGSAIIVTHDIGLGEPRAFASIKALVDYGMTHDDDGFDALTFQIEKYLDSRQPRLEKIQP